MSGQDGWNMASLALFWLIYFAIHSALASLRAKSRIALHFPALMPFYRLCFNGLALLLLLPIAWLTYRHPGPSLWAWGKIGAWGAWLSNGLALAALLGFALSLKYYDMREFLGLRQRRSHATRMEDQERFHLSPFHRHVRHPWYFFGLVMIWTRDMNAALLLSSAMMTIYLAIGSRLEEDKLVANYGDAYRRYMKRVPGLIPLPGKSITAEEAAELAQSAECVVH